MDNAPFLASLSLPQIRKRVGDKTNAIYEIGPLEPGYGWTLAPAMRRALLTSLGGVAITAIALPFALEAGDHRLPGVQEEVEEICLNIKRLRLRSLSAQPAILILQVQGPGVVRAAALQMPLFLELLTPDLPIATLEGEHAHLELRLLVQQGKGYSPAEAHTDLPAGLLALDAVFTPIRKADYTVEATRVGSMVDFERIVLRIETDGRLTPDQAFTQAGEILERYARAIMDVSEPSSVEKRSPHSGILIPAEIASLSVEEIGLPMRLFNTLRRAGISRVGQVLEMDEEAVLLIRNLGMKGQRVLYESLRAAGCLAALLEALSPQNMGEGHEAISSLPSVASVDMSSPRSGTSMVATPTFQPQQMSRYSKKEETMEIVDFFKKKETVTELIDKHDALPPTYETMGPRNEIVGKLERRGVYYDTKSGKWLTHKNRLKQDPRLAPLDEEN